MRTLRLITGRIFLMVSSIGPGADCGILAETGDFLITESGDFIITET